MNLKPISQSISVPDPGTGTAGDDVATLCSESGLKVEAYRTFKREQPNVLAFAGPQRTGEAVHPGQHTGAAANRAEAQFHSRTGPVNPASPHPERWHAIRSILQSATAAARPKDGRTTTPGRLPAGSLSVLSSGGGVGTSTILATLGRIFALRNEQVLLLDGDCTSVLQFYFGHASAVGGACIFRDRMASDEHSIRIVSRRHDTLPRDGASGGDGRESDHSLWSNVELYLEETDRLLVDVWHEIADEIRQKLFQESNCLVVLMPDLRSALHIRTLMELFQRPDTSRSFGPHFLLSQFDAAAPLHQDLRRSLAAQLGERLLPFTIRRTDEVSVAAAEGVTIVDYAPNSGIAEDFHRLANWLVMWQGTQPDERPAAHAAGVHR